MHEEKAYFKAVQQSVEACIQEENSIRSNQVMGACGRSLSLSLCARLTQPAACWPENVNIISFTSCQLDGCSLSLKWAEKGELPHSLTESAAAVLTDPSVLVIQGFQEFCPCNPLHH